MYFVYCWMMTTFADFTEFPPEVKTFQQFAGLLFKGC